MLRTFDSGRRPWATATWPESNGGGGGTRTHKPLRAPVFKTGGITIIRPLHASIQYPSNFFLYRVYSFCFDLCGVLAKFDMFEARIVHRPSLSLSTGAFWGLSERRLYLSGDSDDISSPSVDDLHMIYCRFFYLNPLVLVYRKLSMAFLSCKKCHNKSCYKKLCPGFALFQWAFCKQSFCRHDKWYLDVSDIV